MKLPATDRATDFIAEAITEAFGERCPDYAEGCAACDAWKQRDDMVAVLREAADFIHSIAAKLCSTRSKPPFPGEKP